MAMAQAPNFTSAPLIASQGKMLVRASGLVTGKGMQRSPAMIRPKPSNLSAFFMLRQSVIADGGNQRCGRSCSRLLADCVGKRSRTFLR